MFPLPLPPEPVLRAFPEATGGRWSPLPTRGLSGAELWRGEKLVLKAHRSGVIAADKLAQIHAWQKVAGEPPHHLPFVPRVLRTRSGASFVTHAGRLWEMTTWMPGAADFHTHPSDARLQAACAALALLHRCWQRDVPPLATAPMGPIPGVLRRLKALSQWRDEPPPLAGEALLLWRQARDDLRRLRPEAITALSRWASCTFPLQPCLCDIHHDHVLFSGEEVSGIIDYAAMAIDHPAVDLARLLGSLVPGDERAFARGLNAYQQAGGHLAIPDHAVAFLAETGTLASLAAWMTRLHQAPHLWTDLPPLPARLQRLLHQLSQAAPRRWREAAPVPFRPSRSLE